MQSKAPLKQSLVLYKNQPALVNIVSGKKIEIETCNGKHLKVRPKDIQLLHPGPISSLSDLKEEEGEIEVAWELLAGQETTIASLAELAHGDFTPNSAWSTWKWVEDGLYFSGTPDLIEVHSADKVEELKEQREAKEREQEAWQSFIGRLAEGYYAEADKQYLQEVAALARGETESSRILRDLGSIENEQNAHAFLLAVGYWDEKTNPYPARAGLPIKPPVIDMPEMLEETRRDLRHLISLAIDDAGSRDPDDALSWENGRLWVHIADVAAQVSPDSPADVEARARAANLYLPEGTVPMLPVEVTAKLALGLEEVSPALSFGFDLDPDGQISNLEIVPSLVRVTRMTYEEAETRLDEEPLRQIAMLARSLEKRRLAAGAIEINLPEVKVRVEEHRVIITPLPSLVSRDLVREAMLLTGSAVGRYCLEHNLAIPFTGQGSPVEQAPFAPESLSEMFALRRLMKPSQQSITPLAHAGLGLDIYVQATSPLRRYLDLVVHQQLRAHLLAKEPLNSQDLMQRVGAAEALTRKIRRTERLSNTHWTLVYLQQNPNWSGSGYIIEKYGKRDKLLVPDLDLETEIYLDQDYPLDSRIELELLDVNLSLLEAKFKQSTTDI